MKSANNYTTLEKMVDEDVPEGMPEDVYLDLTSKCRFRDIRKLRDAADHTVNGGLRNVYLATFRGKKVILKLDKKNYHCLNNPRFARLIEEQNTEKEVNLFDDRISEHPHSGLTDIVFVRDFRDKYGATCTVSAEKFIEDSCNLEDYVKRNCLRDKDILNISRQLTGIVDHLNNTAKIYHRDLKPSNVLIRKGRKGLEVFVVDYANGKGVEEKTNFYAPSHGGRSVTDPLMVEEGSSYDFQSEVYSLGATLGYLLTGEHRISTEVVDENNKVTFDTKTGERLVDGFGNVDKKRVEDVIDDYLGGLKGMKKRIGKIVKKAITPHKEDRYKNVAEMKKDLEKIAEWNICSVPLARKVSPLLRNTAAGALLAAASGVFMMYSPAEETFTRMLNAGSESYMVAETAGLRDILSKVRGIYKSKADSVRTAEREQGIARIKELESRISKLDSALAAERVLQSNPAIDSLENLMKKEFKARDDSLTAVSNEVQRVQGIRDTLMSVVDRYMSADGKWSDYRKYPDGMLALKDAFVALGVKDAEKISDKYGPVAFKVVQRFQTLLKSKYAWRPDGIPGHITANAARDLLNDKMNDIERNKAVIEQRYLQNTAGLEAEIGEYRAKARKLSLMRIAAFENLANALGYDTKSNDYIKEIQIRNPDYPGKIDNAMGPKTYQALTDQGKKELYKLGFKWR